MMLIPLFPLPSNDIELAAHESCRLTPTDPTNKLCANSRETIHRTPPCLAIIRLPGNTFNRYKHELDPDELDPVTLNSIAFNAIKSGGVFHAVVCPHTIIRTLAIIRPLTITLTLAIIRHLRITLPHTIIHLLAINLPHAIHNGTVGGTKSDPFSIRGVVLDHRNIGSHAKKQMTSGTIAGIVLGVFFIVTIMLLTFLLRKRRHQGRARDRPKPEGYPYPNPVYETPSSSQALTSRDALSASPSTEARPQATALKGAVSQPSAPYHEEENSSLRQTNEDLQARVRTLEMQLQSPWTGDSSSEEPPGYLE
ncbi:hypothetical protein K438DRAFT_1758759 [Mycena galopus ATCC 62051]|nr:hypothetical protein K438DRAFT_1758759 [Mycena galopus ATCC 62051]